MAKAPANQAEAPKTPPTMTVHPDIGGSITLKNGETRAGVLAARAEKQKIKDEAAAKKKADAVAATTDK